MNQTKKLVDTIVSGIQEKKGEDITIVDLSHIDGTIANYFVICQGNSPTQVEAIAGSVGDMVREELHEKPANVIGLGSDQWVDRKSTRLNSSHANISYAVFCLKKKKKKIK